MSAEIKGIRSSFQPKRKGKKGVLKVASLEDLPELKEQEKEEEPEEDEGKVLRVDIVKKWFASGLKNVEDIDKKQLTDILNFKISDEKLFTKQNKTIIIEVINLIREEGTDEVLKYLNRISDREKLTSEEMKDMLTFENISLKQVNEALEAKDAFMLRKPTTRKGVYPCPHCKQLNTIHFKVVYRGDEAAAVYGHCLICPPQYADFRG